MFSGRSLYIFDTTKLDANLILSQGIRINIYTFATSLQRNEKIFEVLAKLFQKIPLGFTFRKIVLCITLYTKKAHPKVRRIIVLQTTIRSCTAIPIPSC